MIKSDCDFIIDLDPQRSLVEENPCGSNPPPNLGGTEGEVWDHISCIVHSPQHTCTPHRDILNMLCCKHPQLREKCPSSRCVSGAKVADSWCSSTHTHQITLQPPVDVTIRQQKEDERLSNFLPLLVRHVLKWARHAAWWHSYISDMCKYVWRHRTSTAKWHRWPGTLPRGGRAPPQAAADGNILLGPLKSSFSSACSGSGKHLRDAGSSSVNHSCLGCLNRNSQNKRCLQDSSPNFRYCLGLEKRALNLT